jgi:hypothetical protein
VSDVVRNLARLYARRESQCESDSPERWVLARARIQAEDDAGTIALVAIGLTAVTWFILPVVAVTLAAIFRG